MIEEYLKNILGLECRVDRFHRRLPPYLLEDRKYKILTIEGQKYLLMEYAWGSFKLPQAKKQLIALRKYCDYPVIIALSEISSYQIKALIKERIPFIVPNKQIYIPDLGLAFERIRREKMAKKGQKEMLSGPAQLVITMYILNRLPDIRSQKDIARLLDLNDMAVSRAVSELVEFGLIVTERQGTSIEVKPIAKEWDLFEKARSLMRSPVLKTKFVLKKDIPKDVVLSGESALAAQTMLGAPIYDTYALTKKEYSALEELDPDWMVESDVVLIEEWMFDPKKTAKNGMIDPVSLILMMRDSDDERIEMEVEELKERVFHEGA